MMTGMTYYILEDKKVLECDVYTWSNWFEKNFNARQVALSTVDFYEISTVFLGLDHNYFGGRPLMFETMIFIPMDDIYCKRHSTYEEAELGHEEAKEWLSKYIANGCKE